MNRHPKTANRASHAARYLWRPPRTATIDECFGALGRALYLAQCYEYEAREAAVVTHFEELMDGARKKTREGLAKSLRSRPLHQQVMDLTGGDLQHLLTKAKEERNYLAHQAAHDLATVARARSRRAMLLKKFLARL